MPVLAVAGAYMGGWWHLLVPGFVFILIPLADVLVGVDRSNVTSGERTELDSDPYYLILLRAWVPVQVAYLIWGAVWLVSTESSLSTKIVFTLTTGLISGGVGITVAHELGHKRSRLDRFLAQSLLMTVCYMHFTLEHNRGHHVRVATPDDPATARYGENAYRFWWRSVTQSFLHAWELENTRGATAGRWLYVVLPLACCGLLTAVGFWFSAGSAWTFVPAYFLIQSVVAFTLLELVNYVEHYGITRKQLPGGRYEPVNPMHSWNTSYLVSSLLLFQLQRHSDHHAHADKHYQVLDHVEESPQLPYGYPLMVLIAAVPPLWFRIMDPLLANWHRDRAARS